MVTQEISTKSVTKIPVLKITQKGASGDSKAVDLYIGAMTLEDLNRHTVTDAWTTNNQKGYQRPLEKRRIRAVAKYMREAEGILPTSVLLGIRKSEGEGVKEIGFTEHEPGVSIGVLEFEKDARLWRIDGQHRLEGVSSAVDDDGIESLKQFRFPVAIMSEIERFDEMMHFNIINTTQRKMSTDIVDRHLLIIQEQLGADMLIKGGAKAEKDYMRATATRMVDNINKEPGPWHGRIRIPGVEGRDSGIVRQHAFVTSLDPVMKDNWVQGLSDDDRLKVVLNYWAAAADVWPQAFAAPEDYRIQATVGLYSMHMILPILIQMCRDTGDLTKSSFARLIKEFDVPTEFWSKGDEGDPRTLGTGMSSIRALKQYLLNRLPESKSTPVLL